MYREIPKTNDFLIILYGKTEEIRKLTFLVTEEFKISAMPHCAPPHPSDGPNEMALSKS